MGIQWPHQWQINGEFNGETNVYINGQRKRELTEMMMFLWIAQKLRLVQAPSPQGLQFCSRVEFTLNPSCTCPFPSQITSSVTRGEGGDVPLRGVHKMGRGGGGQITSQRLLDQSQAGVYRGKRHIPPHFGLFRPIRVPYLKGLNC